MGTKENNELGDDYSSLHQLPCIFDDMEIKQEEVDYQFQHNSTSHSDAEDNVSNILHVDCGSDKSEEKDLSDFYLDLVKCDRSCATCQKYMTLLSEHVRATHDPPEPIQDPLLIDIDPLNIEPDPRQPHQSPFVQVKSEMEEGIVKMELCSDEESKSDSENIDFNLESESDHDPPLTNQSSSIQIKCVVDKGNVELESSDSEGESALNSDPTYNTENDGENENDPDFCPSHSLAQKLPRQSQGSVKNHASSESGRSKTEKGIPPTRGKWKCHVCGESFRLMINLKEHMSFHGGEKPFKCDVCEKCFESKSRLKSHKIVHTGEKPFKCDECDMNFTAKPSLITHMRRHTGERPYECSVCNKSFISSTDLTRHKRIHTGERPYTCDVCEKTFTSSSDCNKHKIIHTGERPFECDECKKRFSRSSHLAKHKKIHTLKKLKDSTLCGKSSLTLSALNAHTSVRGQTTGNIPDTGGEHKKIFRRSDRLMEHKRK